MQDERSGWIPANHGISPQEVTVGAAVFGSDGQEIGRVKEVLADCFHVDRQYRRDVYLPFSRVNRVEMARLAKRLILDVPHDEVDKVTVEPPHERP